ncbi:MAG: glycosyltransferase [Actinomycetota bacterium]|nr:glycosyltransferase [Actinomycetota bacterium]
MTCAPPRVSVAIASQFGGSPKAQVITDGAAIEAAVAGCAVIASAHGGLPKIIRDGETGRLIAPGDPAALAAVAAQLLDDPREPERLGWHAARDVRGRFASARLAEKIAALYATVLR